MSSAVHPSSGAPGVDEYGGPSTQPEATRQLATRSKFASMADRVHYAALLLVVASSPFEAGYRPVGRFLWATYTNLEGAIFLLAAAWLLKLAVDPQARGRFLRLPLLLPFAALVGATVLSTLFGEYTSLGGHVVYRFFMGFVVYTSACEALRSRRRLVIALYTLVTAGAVSAALGLLEFAPGIDIQPWLKPFKPQPTTVGGTVRLSGTFEYANGAALYFEMALPVLVSLGVLFSSVAIRNSRRVVAPASRSWHIPMRFGAGFGLLALLFVAALIYSLALILTLSRAALVGVAIALVIFGAVGFFKRNVADGHLTRIIGSVVGVAFVALLAGGLLVFATQPMFRLRLTTENDRAWYGAALTTAPLPALSAGEVISVPLTIRNTGQMTWPAAGVLPIHISYHWLDPRLGVYLVFEGLRTALPHDISPGETLSVIAIVQAPPRPGDYRLQWDLVHESVTWFQAKQGMNAGVVAYHIREPASTGSQAVLPAGMPQPFTLDSSTDFASVGRWQLWKVALDMFRAHPITGVGPDGFRNLYGVYAGVTQWNKNIYTNNTYLEMFTNLGVLGGISFLWLAGLALWRSGRNLLREPIGPVWIVGVGATAAIVAFFVHGVVDYFLFATPMYVLFWFLLSVAVNWPARNDI